MKKINILFVGAGAFPVYEEAFYNAANSMDDVKASLFTWKSELKKIKNPYIRRFENKFGIGKDIVRINDLLINNCYRNSYDFIFLYTCRLIFPNTVKKIKEMGAFVACYNNDNPFSDWYPRYFWRHWRGALKYCDFSYVYRQSNIDECIRNGVSKSKMLRSYFIEERNYYIPDKDINIDVPQVVFLGHREKDEREEYIRALAKAGVTVGIPNQAGWENFEKNNGNIVKLEKTLEIYNELINKAKICLVFLSKINKDTYTRRCFEIPAAKTMMVSEYTDDLASLFEENEEIIFFRNESDLINKVQYYLDHEEQRERVAEAAYKRLIKDGHSAKSRVETIISDYREWFNR